MGLTGGEQHHPHPALHGLIGSCSGYFAQPDPRSVHFGVPSPTATVIIAFDRPLHVGLQATPQHRQRLWVSVAGLHLRPALIRTHGHQHGIHLALTPRGCRALLGVPIGELSDTVVGHDDLGLPLSHAAYDALASARSWSERWSVLDTALVELAARARATPSPAAETEQAWRLIVASRGQVGIAEVASQVGWSRRHLGHRFHQEYGLTPKQAARLVRLTAARAHARAGHSLAASAAATGYADQSHLTREWREFAGQPPTASLIEPFPILQDTAGGLAPPSLA